MPRRIYQGRTLSGRPLSVGFISILTCAAIFVGKTSGLAAAPRGVFSLSPAGVPCRDAILSNPSVDGVSIRQNWSDLEPSEGVYDWSFLDAEIERVAAAGKMVLLRINTQIAKPDWVTNAVKEAGGAFFTFENDGVAATIPVFWDPTFLAKKKAMIAALGAHFTNNSAIKIAWTSFANANSEDWSVPHTPTDVTNWLALGYTTEKLLDAGKQIIDSTMSAFPNQFVTLAVAGNGRSGLDPDENYVARNAILAARATWPGRLIVQKNNLAAFNPPAPGIGTVWEVLWDSQPEVGGQMLDACFGDTTYRNNGGVADDPAVILRKSIDLGVAYGMNHIEIYQLDVLNLSGEITYAHAALFDLAPPEAGSKPNPPTGVQVLP